VAKLFDGYGRIIDCRVMTGFGFVEFENSKDAEDAVHNFNGKPFMGVNIVVEFAKESRPRREVHDSDRPGGYGGPTRTRRPPGIRVIVSGVSRDTSWQDLKDFGRDAGNVSFADIDRDFPGQGILEYLAREDADRAVRELDGKDLRGRPVRVAYDDSRTGPDNYRRDDRREDRAPREDRYRDDRYRDERFRDDRYRGEDRHREERSTFRRERSRSPPRRAEVEDRRPRSPPPRREVDDRRPAGDDSDRRRDDRRRDEKEERYEDRTRHTNGEGGWTR